MRISDSKNSLRYNEDGHIVFIAATYGIIYNRDNQVQQQSQATPCEGADKQPV